MKRLSLDPFQSLNSAWHSKSGVGGVSTKARRDKVRTQMYNRGYVVEYRSRVNESTRIPKRGKVHGGVALSLLLCRLELVKNCRSKVHSGN
ncbi:MAG: hypothetical protein GY821_07265 [Gammaproteobacteria bacterium]|nr:hypothetical protein [Gammaproteobacteria bacterium]